MQFRSVNGKLLRRGYTTGSCAAAAAQAAAEFLLGGTAPETVTLSTPKGPSLTLDVVEARMEGKHDSASSGRTPETTRT